MGLSIDEVSEDSVQRIKKIPEEVDGDMTLMQITIDNHGIVYNLQDENQYEIAIIGDIDSFDDPISFAHTGFVYRTSKKRSSSCYSVALWRPAMQDRLLYRPFFEMNIK